MTLMPAGAPTIQIPRWIQLVGVPILALIALLIVGKVFHAVFLFLVAGLIALLLDPLVRALEKLWIPRGLSIAIVYLSFAAALAVVVFAIGVVVVDQTESAANRIDAYLTTESGQPLQTGFEQDVDRLQHWLDTHHLERIDIEEQGQDFADNIQGQDVEKYTSDVIDFVRGAAISIFQLLFSIVLIVVVSIYMLLDMSRLKRAVDRRLPPSPGKPGLVVQMEKAVAGYVRGQLLLSLIIGTSAGIGLWVLGTIGLVEGGDTYAVLFGAWVAVTELIPYLGPVARGDPAGHLRARRRPDLGDLGHAPVPRHPPDRGARRRPEGDGERASPAPAARHLRIARGRGALRAARDLRRAAVPGGRAARCGSSSASGSSWSHGRGRGACRGGGGGDAAGEAGAARRATRG